MEQHRKFHHELAEGLLQVETAPSTMQHRQRHRDKADRPSTQHHAPRAMLPLSQVSLRGNSTAATDLCSCTMKLKVEQA